MEIEVIASKRELQGTGASRRLRHAGKVPGIVYGGSTAPVQIELDHNALYHALRKEAFHASVLSLSVDGAKESVLLRDAQWHPYKQQVLHVDFQRVDKDHKIHVKVPLHFLNAEVSPGVKLGGGKPHHIVNELDVQCFPGSLPEFIEVDMGALEVGHSIHANDLVLPAGVELVAHVKQENPAVAVIHAPKGGVEETPAAPAA
ncbi:Ribosomal protein L25 [Thiobacillus denitrificans ATCC 25259]|uniref:Large ribosomal subunit protein bL25 n=1 Tax=Thiobacillus denitrificans (strain ATCC 25259 / T1) TaxID=292415 RepID=RL25_THIDA|nr:50S ribosomal protein L25/general stress protein Ctc [Thiobacillus denitrificans]Q3SLR4.1 RecName: Full=Large ribosomal subunit protein bL25; AltName: Full=50S ribosomal protein L25; AltName: Full=General stress protein CTC [Thiobacillus denitrificans ATCC 25259]AAZ96341.1 Ribosomal protein L25 [Thiobacillus denitrificans ATCC 25259]